MNYRRVVWVGLACLLACGDVPTVPGETDSGASAVCHHEYDASPMAARLSEDPSNCGGGLCFHPGRVPPDDNCTSDPDCNLPGSELYVCDTQTSSCHVAPNAPDFPSECTQTCETNADCAGMTCDEPTCMAVTSQGPHACVPVCVCLDQLPQSSTVGTNCP